MLEPGAVYLLVTLAVFGYMTYKLNHNPAYDPEDAAPLAMVIGIFWLPALIIAAFVWVLKLPSRVQRHFSQKEKV